MSESKARRRLLRYTQYTVEGHAPQRDDDLRFEQLYLALEVRLAIR